MDKGKKYFILRLVSFLQDFIFSLMGPFITRKNRIIFNSSHNNHFSFNSKYLFLYYLKEFPEVEVKFVINDIGLKDELIKTYGDFFIDSRSIKNKFFILSAKVWVTSTMETPLFGFFYGINRSVIHLSHGVVFKNAGVAENQSKFLKKIYYAICRTNFTKYLATSKNLIDATASVYGEKNKSKFIVDGFPRNDIVKNLEKGSRKILYAPTWRKGEKGRLLPCFPGEESKLDSVLEASNFELYIRQHPLYEYEQDFMNFNNIFNFDAKICRNINDRLHEFSILITDYSSLFIDSLFIGQATCFYPYDYNAYCQKIGFLFDYHSYLPGPEINSLSELRNFLDLVSSGRYSTLESYKKSKSFFFDNYDRDSSKRLARLINSYLS